MGDTDQTIIMDEALSEDKAIHDKPQEETYLEHNFKNSVGSAAIYGSPLHSGSNSATQTAEDAAHEAERRAHHSKLGSTFAVTGGTRKGLLAGSSTSQSHVVSDEASGQLENPTTILENSGDIMLPCTGMSSRGSVIVAGSHEQVTIKSGDQTPDELAHETERKAHYAKLGSTFTVNSGGKKNLLSGGRRRAQTSEKPVNLFETEGVVPPSEIQESSPLESSPNSPLNSKHLDFNEEHTITEPLMPSSVCAVDNEESAKNADNALANMPSTPSRTHRSVSLRVDSSLSHEATPPPLQVTPNTDSKLKSESRGKSMKEIFEEKMREQNEEKKKRLKELNLSYKIPVSASALESPQTTDNSPQKVEEAEMTLAERRMQAMKEAKAAKEARLAQYLVNTNGSGMTIKERYEQARSTQREAESGRLEKFRVRSVPHEHSPKNFQHFWGDVLSNSASLSDQRADATKQRTRSQFRTTDGTGFVKRRIGQWEELFMCMIPSGPQLLETVRAATLLIADLVESRSRRKREREARRQNGEDVGDDSDDEEALKTGTKLNPEIFEMGSTHIYSSRVLDPGTVDYLNRALKTAKSRSFPCGAYGEGKLSIEVIAAALKVDNEVYVALTITAKEGHENDANSYGVKRVVMFDAPRGGENIEKDSIFERIVDIVPVEGWDAFLDTMDTELQDELHTDDFVGKSEADQLTADDGGQLVAASGSEGGIENIGVEGSLVGLVAANSSDGVVDSIPSETAEPLASMEVAGGMEIDQSLRAADEMKDSVEAPLVSHDASSGDGSVYERKENLECPPVSDNIQGGRTLGTTATETAEVLPFVAHAVTDGAVSQELRNSVIPLVSLPEPVDSGSTVPPSAAVLHTPPSSQASSNVRSSVGRPPVSQVRPMSYAPPDDDVSVADDMTSVGGGDQTNSPFNFGRATSVANVKSAKVHRPIDKKR
jgi:hypothetical protein